MKKSYLVIQLFLIGFSLPGFGIPQQKETEFHCSVVTASEMRYLGKLGQSYAPQVRTVGEPEPARHESWSIQPVGESKVKLEFKFDSLKAESVTSSPKAKNPKKGYRRTNIDGLVVNRSCPVQIELDDSSLIHCSSGLRSEHQNSLIQVQADMEVKKQKRAQEFNGQSGVVDETESGSHNHE